jgi:hypothetical protein
MLEELLASDPALARRFFQPLAGTVFPIVGGVCSVNPGDICPGAFVFAANADNAIPLTAKGNSASQSADLQQWQKSDGSVLATVKADGKVGIGTAPASLLHISAAGQAKLTVEATSGDAQIDFRASGAGGRTWLFQTGDTTSGLSGRFRIHDSTAGQERLTILTDGKVGIGVSNPAAALHVQRSGQTKLQVEATSGDAQIDFRRRAREAGRGCFRPGTPLRD